MLSSITAGGLTLTAMAICSIASIVLGTVIAIIHAKTSRSTTKNFAMTLVILPILVQSVMMIVNGNLGTGIAILGAFSLVRFRSIPGTSREIVSVFFAMAIGLATGTGFVLFALILTTIISLVLVAFHVFNFFGSPTSTQTLRLTIPEDIDYEKAFHKVFAAHQVSATLAMIKTKNMGSLFEVTYDVELPAEFDRTSFINDLRLHNNNLAIALYTQAPEGGL